jgi:hypothetical protein
MCWVGGWDSALGRRNSRRKGLEAMLGGDIPDVLEEGQ